MAARGGGRADAYGGVGPGRLTAPEQVAARGGPERAGMAGPDQGSPRRAVPLDAAGRIGGIESPAPIGGPDAGESAAGPM